jgi:WD40 repeat protein
MGGDVKGVPLKYELRSHMDSVRGLKFVSSIDSLCSISEDCTVKIWSIRSLIEKDEDANFEPFITLRGHTGPLFTIQGGL